MGRVYMQKDHPAVKRPEAHLFCYHRSQNAAMLSTTKLVSCTVTSRIKVSSDVVERRFGVCTNSLDSC